MAVKKRQVPPKTETQKANHDVEVYQIEMESQNTELRRVQEELEGQQIELELQNEELRRAQEELEVSRNKYSELYDFAPVGYFTFDTRGIIREVNLTGAHLLGREQQELTGKPFAGFIADADGKAVFSRHLENVLQKRGMQKCDIKLNGKQGTVIHGQFQSVTVDAIENKDISILSSIVDGTVARQLETEIQDAREYAENIVETVHKPLLVLNSDLKIITANVCFYETFKVTPEETIGNFIYDLGNRQWDIPELRVLFEDILPHNTVVTGFEVDHNFQNIGRTVILLNARQIFRKNIGSHIILLAMEDITARKQLEAEQKLLDQRLRDHQFYTRSLIESNIDAIMTTDPFCIITDVNKQMEILTGCTRDELIGAPFKNYFTDPDRAETGIKQVLNEKKITNYELTASARDGNKTVVSLNATTFYDRDRKLQGVFVAARDVTERKQLDQELENAKYAAEKANLAKSDFLSSMSHELRTPLGAILGFAQLVESGSPLPTPSQKRSIDQILKAGWYLLELINEILDLALIESGKLSLSLESVSLEEVLRECETMVEPQAKKRGISVIFTHCLDHYCVNADRTRVKQILINLLSNAIKYNKSDGTVTVACTLSPPDSIRISVRDTGAGLSPEQLAQLFQPFNRLGQKNNIEESTGIGLVVCKRLVELMQGNIGMESTVGEGSIFWFELNRTTEPNVAAHIAELTSVDRMHVQGATMHTLLYVEDNPANLMLVEDLVARRHDIRLLSARDGISGIAIARASLPDVILMDINLPGISGLKALKILADDPSTAHIPVVALSANAIPRDIEKGLEAGFFRYLTKPIKVNEFMDTLEVALKYAKKEHI